MAKRKKKKKPQTMTEAISAYTRGEAPKTAGEVDEYIGDESELEKPDGDDATRFERAPFDFKVGFETMPRYYMSAQAAEDKVFSVLGPPPNELAKPHKDDFQSDSAFREAELRYYKRRAHVLALRCASLENRVRDLKNLQGGLRAAIRRERKGLKDKDREDVVKCDIRYVKVTAELSMLENELNITDKLRKQADGSYQQRSRAIELLRLK